MLVLDLLKVRNQFELLASQVSAMSQTLAKDEVETQDDDRATDNDQTSEPKEVKND